MKGERSATLRRRMSGAVTAATLAIAASLVFAAPARAATTVITTDAGQEAWYWQSNQDLSACTPDNPTNQGLCNPQHDTSSAANPISPGHLGVSWSKGAADMWAYMQFPLDPITFPTGSIINSFVLTLTVSRSDASDQNHTAEHTPNAGGAQNSQPKSPATLNDQNAQIQSCGLLRDAQWGNVFGSPPETRNTDDPTKLEPSEPVTQQAIDTATCKDGKRGDKAWTFDLTQVAKKWIAGTTVNNGFALLPKGGPTDNWIVEFHGAFARQGITNADGSPGTRILVSHNEEAKTSVDYVPGVLPNPTPTETPIETPPPPTTTGGGGGLDLTPPPAAPGGSPTPIPSTNPSPTLPVASSKPSTPWYAWLMLPIGLLGFVTLSRSLGREVEGGTDNRVAEVLRRRRNPDSTGD